MEETLYSLMHRDDPVCAISIDTASGAILRVSKPVSPELLPLSGSQLVRNKDVLDLSKLPTEEELRRIYDMDTLIPRVDSIMMGYQKKIEMLKTL